MTNPLVSVIIPVYNVEPFIEETIQSILDQSYKNIELILVNDGSKDRSGSICERYASKGEKIYYFEQGNQGVSVARNNGLQKATGDYVYFMDSDDTIDSDYIHSSVNAILAKRADMVIIGEYYCERLPNVMALPTCAAMFKREFLMRYPEVRFPEGIQPCEDGLFTHRLLALTTKIAENQSGIYHYRQHANQNHVKINDNCERVLKQIPQWFEILRTFYLKHDLLGTHYMHLALFLEHEPYELRYRAMPMTKGQRSQLYRWIKEMLHEYVLDKLTVEDKKKFTYPFQALLRIDTSEEFEKYYAKSRKRKKYLWRLYKLIPNKKLKLQLAKNLDSKYGI